MQDWLRVFDQDLPQMYENTTLTLENACFETYLIENGIGMREYTDENG